MKNIFSRERAAAEKDPMQLQDEIHLLEETAGLIGATILILGFLEAVGLFHDSHMFLLLLILGILMNAVSAARDRLKGQKILLWAELAGCVVCLTGVVWLLLF